MNTPQRQRVRDLFEQAVDVEPAALDAWVAREVPDDPDVAAEVRSLLRHHREAGSFLAAPALNRVVHLLDDDPRFEPGSVVGTYTVIREIGRGGMGRVYLATDARLGRTVALKALPLSLTRDRSQRERLRREARAAASLTHPGICTIYALEELDDDVVIVSEFIDGRSLRREIADGEKPSAALLLQSARDLADALASAHDKGMTHRDLKPENVMRDRHGRLKILDFGLAIVDPSMSADVASWRHVTQPGSFVGTPAYMAPEQLNGSGADPRSDVFALCVLLYEYASGVHPFGAATPLELAARVLEGTAVPMLERRPDVSRQLAAVIDRGLRRAPDERFRSASEVRDAVLRDDLEVASPVVQTWWRTHQLIVLALYFVACALAWQIKEWLHGPSARLFLVVGVASMVAGVLRGHLLFTERMNRASFGLERGRAEPLTLVADVVVAGALGIDGWMLAAEHPLAALLTLAMAAGIALARFVVERSTTRAAFDRS